jgi:hypothetical protein
VQQIRFIHFSLFLSTFSKTHVTGLLGWRSCLNGPMKLVMEPHEATLSPPPLPGLSQMYMLILPKPTSKIQLLV